MSDNVKAGSHPPDDPFVPPAATQAAASPALHAAQGEENARILREVFGEPDALCLSRPAHPCGCCGYCGCYCGDRL